MRRTTRHVSDGELLLLDEDGALSARRRSAVGRHVAACPRCAARRAELAGALAEAAAVCRETPAGASPPHVARARLRAGIEAPPSGSFTERPSAGWPLGGWSLGGWSLGGWSLGGWSLGGWSLGGWSLGEWSRGGWSPGGWSLGGWSLAGRPSRLAAAVVGVVAAFAVMSWPGSDEPGAPDPPAFGAPGPGGEPAPASAGLERPRQDLTPGSVLPVGVDEICGGGVTGLPPVAAQVPRQVFEAYGVDFQRAAEYELDFLITPELGGAPDPRNLWPQPYRAGVWNAYVKDELERELQDLVCRGTLDLATAQQELANDWIAAYKRRFNTDRPLRDYGLFPLAPDDVEAWRSELAERRLLPAGWSLASARTGAAAPVYATAGRRFVAAGG